jgi:hypothetical protein
MHSHKDQEKEKEKEKEKEIDILNHKAVKFGADMHASGTFGHSQAYNFVIGAATRALFNDAKLPDLLSK